MNAAKTVAFHTLGCKLNFAETSAIARLFSEKGFVKKRFDEAADVYVLNTCSVTANADQECRSVVRSALAKNPEAFVAVVGCYAQLKPMEISSIPGVDVVLGAADKFRILDFIRATGKNDVPEVRNCEISDVNSFTAAFSQSDRTRAFLKVQDGCDYSCSFCTIPLARGKSRSDTIENVVQNARMLAASGVREIVLTGVNLGDFGYGREITVNGRKRRESDFIDLIRELDSIDGVRFRISSIEPNLLTDEIVEFVAGSQRFTPHFHIPLQSGSDRILGLMKRRYRTALYRDKVALIKSRMPHACIGVDVITGFPGEGEQEFMETYEFLNSLDISYLHVFTYSERDNTPAILMPDAVPAVERKRRNKRLRMLSAAKLRMFNESQLNRELEVIFEHENRNGFMHGYSENYVRLCMPYDASFCNQPLTVLPERINDEGLVIAALPAYSTFLPQA